MRTLDSAQRFITHTEHALLIYIPRNRYTDAANPMKILNWRGPSRLWGMPFNYLHMTARRPRHMQWLLWLCACAELQITTHLLGTVGQTLAPKIQFYDLQNRACRYMNGGLRFSTRSGIVATALTEQHVRVLWNRGLLVVPMEYGSQWYSHGAYAANDSRYASPKELNLDKMFLPKDLQHSWNACLTFYSSSSWMCVRS